MFNNKTGYSTREERIEIFQDTLTWIKEDPALSASVVEAKKKTKVYYEDDYPQFDMNSIKDEQISVTRDRSYQAAMRLAKENPGKKIAVMNFANAFHAGGGVTRGASAQEEWVKVDVVTIAAPDLRSKSNMYAAIVGNGTYMNNAELFGYHVKRAIHMLTVAASKGADILVLGAFGCGAFQNDPAVVAKAYKIALEEFPKVFDKVEFAVYCALKDQRNYEEFHKVLG